MKLRLAISLAASAMTWTETGAADPVLPVIEVTAGPDTGTVFLGPVGPGGYWTWDGSGDTSPPSGITYAPALCGIMSAYGKPADCTRDKIEGTPDDAPRLPQPVGWEALGLSNRDNEEILFQCYRNPATDPVDCEAGFRVAMAQKCAGLFNNVYEGFGSNYRTCMDGYVPVDNEVVNAMQLRGGASWFGFQLSPSMGPFELNVNVPWLDVNNWSPFLRLLVYARKVNSCVSWYHTWDNMNCNSYYEVPG